MKIAETEQEDWIDVSKADIKSLSKDKELQVFIM
jgi:hypothetical protein